MKLAQSVGNTVAMKEGGDDGITTGWICCNLGAIDEVGETDAEEEHTNLESGYAGFGSKTNAPRIVVQMFTEDKRLEMDLEGLWDMRNTRRTRKEQKLVTAAATKDMEKEYSPKLEDEEENEIAEQEEIEERENNEDLPSNDDTSGSGTKTQIEDEIDSPEKREGMDESQPMGGIGAS